MTNYFDELARVDVSAHVEKKGRFTYLSWPFAMSELAKRHPDAEIEVREWDGFPATRGPKGWMVQVAVTIKGIKRTQWHPVLDANNRAIAEPDVFQLNTSIQRATVKAIALHGLGLYIYAGEDLPEGAAANQAEPEPESSTVTKINPMAGVWESLTAERAAQIRDIAATAQEYLDNDDIGGARDYLGRAGLQGAEEQTAATSCFASYERAAMKKHRDGDAEGALAHLTRNRQKRAA